MVTEASTEHAIEKASAGPQVPAIDLTTLHPLSPEVISRQATINIGEIISARIISEYQRMLTCILLIFYYRDHWSRSSW
jgi:hypothetical protein